MLLFAEDLN